jgi:hypothetical protein
LAEFERDVFSKDIDARPIARTSAFRWNRSRAFNVVASYLQIVAGRGS